MVNVSIMIIIAVIFAVVFCALGVFAGMFLQDKRIKKDTENAKNNATKIINDALNEAEASKKAMLVEAKDEIHKLRSDADKEIRERRNEVQRQEKRLTQREEYLDKRADTLETTSEHLSEKLKQVDDKLLEIDGIKKSQFDMLERISGLSQEDA